MTLPLRSAWSELRSLSPRPDGEGFRMRLLAGTAGIRVYAAVSESALVPAILVEMPAPAASRVPGHLSSRAFAVQSAEFPGLTAGQKGVMIALRDPQTEDLFTLLAEEVGSAVLSVTSADNAAAVLGRVIDRWRRFVERGRAPLPDERSRGLIGELVVLARVIGKLNVRGALVSWTGPEDALRDFEMPNESVEVKSFQSDSGAHVWINDPQQLDTVAARPVFLVAVQLARVESSGRTLPQFVQEVSRLTSTDPDGPDLLERRLAEYGYLAAHAPLYGEQYAVERVFSFRVVEGFPRIAASAVPPGVRDVRFSIELAGLQPFAADTDELLGGPFGPLELRA